VLGERFTADIQLVKTPAVWRGTGKQTFMVCATSSRSKSVSISRDNATLDCGLPAAARGSLAVECASPNLQPIISDLLRACASSIGAGTSVCAGKGSAPATAAQGSRKYNTIVLLVNLEIKELIDAGSTNK
jgi:hypothetical protein